LESRTSCSDLVLHQGQQTATFPKRLSLIENLPALLMRLDLVHIRGIALLRTLTFTITCTLSHPGIWSGLVYSDVISVQLLTSAGYTQD
jgi:hypothetical protein